MAISSSAVGKVCGPHLAATATLLATLFVTEVKLTPNSAPALLMVSYSSLTALTACFALSSTIWRDMGKTLFYKELRMPSGCSM